MADQASFDVVMNEVVNGAGNINKASGELSNLKKESEGVTQANKAASFSMTEFNSAVMLGEKGLRLIQDAYGATIAKSQAYAEQVRNLVAVSGEGAESTSRFIQVLDDYQITAEDALAATKKLTSQGYAPNIDTLASLSDEYLKLNTVEDKNAFLTKNLGRAGLEWANVLKQGSAALREQAAAVDAGLILNEKMLANAEKLRLQQDKMNDTWQAISITLGTKFTPYLTAFFDILDQGINTSHSFEDIWNFGFLDLIQAYGDAFNKNAAELPKLTAAQDANAKSAEELAAADKALADAQKAISDANTGFLNSLKSITSMEEDYTKNSKKLADDRIAVMAHIDELRQQGYSYYGATIQGEVAKVREIGQQERELAAARKKQQDEFMLGQALQILSIGGLTTAELNYYLEEGKALGLWTQEYIDKTNAMIAKSKEFADSLPPTQERTITYRVNVEGGNIGGIGGGTPSGTGQGNALEWLQNHGYARGTQNHPGGFAWVGEQGPELVNMPRGSQVIPAPQSAQMANPTADPALLAAIRASKIDESKLARLIVAGMMRGGQ